VLILAGAGTGKTRAITYRMANLITMVCRRSDSRSDFHNKAAEEMRIASPGYCCVRECPLTAVASTFHSLCARLLRREHLLPACLGTSPFTMTTTSSPP